MNKALQNRVHKSDMTNLANKRWNELHSPIHSTGFSVHPAYQGYDQNTYQHAWKDVIDKWYNRETKKNILSQYNFYREKRASSLGRPPTLTSTRMIQSASGATLGAKFRSNKRFPSKLCHNPDLHDHAKPTGIGMIGS